MKIIIISGFLGAGKTSFIKEMAKKTGRQFVIVENEFGELDLDGKMIEAEEKDLSEEEKQMKVWELSEGCICCSLNLDFTHSVLTIANTLSPDYLIVEPSGVALPTRILSQLKKITYERIQLGAPITIIDAKHYKESRKSFSDYFNDQVKAAGSIVLSKSEDLSKEEFLDIKKDIPHNSNVEFFEEHYSNWTKEKWFSLLEKEMVIKKFDIQRGIEKVSFFQPKVRKEQELENMTLTSHNVDSIDRLCLNLEMLLLGNFGKIVRAKGYLKCGGQWVKFDLVESSYAITGCTPMEDQRLVFIGKDLNRQQIESLF